MKLSLSGRILQGAPPMSTPDFLRMAGDAGFDLVELRATQVPVDSTDAELAATRKVLEDAGLGVSMLVIGDAAQAAPWVRVARALGVTHLRAQGTAEILAVAAEALPEDLRIVFQMHSGSIFEDVAMAAQSLREIPGPRFGLLPEPANLLFAGETWSPGLFEPLRDRLFGCNAQSIALDESADTEVVMRDGRKVPYSRLDWAANTALDFPGFVAALRAVGYDGYINFIDPADPATTVQELAAATATYARQVVGA